MISNCGPTTQAAQEAGTAASQVLGAAKELGKNGTTLKTQVESFLREVRVA